MTDITWDRETTGLLNGDTIDYTASPYKLKDTFKTHCIVVEEHDTGKIIAFYDGPTYILDGRSYEEASSFATYTLKDYIPVEYEHRQYSEFKTYILSTDIGKVIAHNQINFDLLVGKLEDNMEYTVEEDTWCGKNVEFVDTLVLSKCLNPDRFGGHSLDVLSEKVSIRKISFRKDLKEEVRFLEFAADMLYYCIYDVKANTQVYFYLEVEKGNWNWKDAISLEKSVAEIITRQTHRGFKFDKTLAEKNVKELDALMEECKINVEPLIPPKPATKTFMKDYIPPALQFKKDRTASVDIIKFAAKVGGVIIYNEEQHPISFEFNGSSYNIPMERVPLITEQVATINDTTHIKEWLVGLGWQPSAYKERDLSVNSKKLKLSREKLVEVIDRYVEQTLQSNFCNDRCEFLNTTPDKLRDRLLKVKDGRSLKVLTNPTFTVGQEKEIDPNLNIVAEDFPFIKSVVEYLTYKHRRNSILGGGVDWDDDEEEPEKGFVAAVRGDGRIPTPADTCGAATSRFKHKVVANIPRVSSLYGEHMRAMFCVDDDFVQIGYDFDSLEAKIESHYCWKYDSEDKGYCKSLTLEKPFDVHTQTALKISKTIGREFKRTPAKSLKYGLSYGAAVGKVSKIVGCDLKLAQTVLDAFWEAAFPLAELKKKLLLYWENVSDKKFILGLDGRKVPTRSAHSTINSLFQSGGVICAKRAMVLHDRMLKAEGFFVDFFKEDWKNRKFSQQLIAYHDEAQLEESRSSVQFKMFKTEQEALAFKECQSSIWSDIKQYDKGYYVAYSRVGELATMAVRQAGEYYKLNVDLTAGYIVHKNWAGCH